MSEKRNSNNNPISLAPSSERSICDSLLRYAEFLGYGDLHIKVDKETGLRAIVAIHNLNRGPAIGGCRMVRYQSVANAIEDCLRLAYMMSFKAAINNLPHGGAKSVIIKPKTIKNKVAFFEKFGEFIEELGGRYIVAVDSGTSPAEMDIIARKTSFVTCTTHSGVGSDPSPLTALGVCRAIEAAVKFKLRKNNLEGVRIAIQGAGHVGYYLAKELTERGAELTMTDVDIEVLQKCVEQFKVKTCAPDEIYSIEADVFAPCALGAILNKRTIAQLKVKIVAGAANNQLAHQQYASLLHERGILYAPDFLINAGGLIHVAVNYDKGDLQQSLTQINHIYDTVYDIYARSQAQNCPTHDIAIKIARERLSATNGTASKVAMEKVR